MGGRDANHALEHIGDAVKAVWGEGTEAARTQRESGRQALVSEGKVGFECWLALAFATVPANVSTDALLCAAGYFGKHPTQLNYAARLASGQSIGSGAVEGVVK